MKTDVPQPHHTTHHTTPQVKREDLHSTVNGPCITDETVTAHIRIDTINSVTLMPCVVGCAVIKVFKAPVSTHNAVLYWTAL